VQRELPTRLPATRATDTPIPAGKIGANVLTALLRINRDEMAEKIAAYRRARSENGHDPDCGKVTSMRHAFLGSDDQRVRRTVSGPFREYLCSHLEFLNSTGAPLSSLQEQELISLAFDRFYKSGSPFGTSQSCWSTVQSLAAMGEMKLHVSSTSGLISTRRWVASTIWQGSLSSLVNRVACRIVRAWSPRHE
jgi:alkanesulfonate monooxygenase SsuD/methylene tetrahydromethanopterin reductase-like flavin-dependent oxidoreductase (luciferase family)